MNNPKLEVKILDEKIREYGVDFATPGSAGIDLRASMKSQDLIGPSERKLIKTGIAVNIADPNIVGFITSRSGLNLKQGIRVSQGVGTIDSDYQDELGVILINDSDVDRVIKPYDRIAQIVFLPVYQPVLDFVEEFSYNTNRGGGFGSTGTQ